MIKLIYKKVLLKNLPRLSLILKNFFYPIILMFDKREKVKGNFVGSQFDRFEGLEEVIKNSRGMTVLDIGMSDGLVSYEFARNGAILIHGIDVDLERVKFAKRLFSNIPIDSFFLGYNLAIQHSSFLNNPKFEKSYDVVLFLDVYHHIKKQMDFNQLVSLIQEFLKVTKKTIAIRTPRLNEINDIIIDSGFEKVSDVENKSVARLGIYNRMSN